MKGLPLRISCSAWAVIALRLIVGLTFVVSGFAKAIDPWGFMYKIEEYLTAWHLSQPRSILLVAAVGLSAYEFVCGLSLMLGSYRKSTPRLLMLTMVVMLPLTGYIAVANPVADCGCFGDLWVLSNWATFFKNIAIVAALIYLMRYNAKVDKSLVAKPIQWIAALGMFAYIACVAFVGYMVQPLIDFRAYPDGSKLVVDNGADDSPEDTLVFVYQKDGIEEEFALDNLPDSTWTFVERKELSDLSDKHSDATFAIFDGDDDVTDEVIGTGKQLLITIPDPDDIDVAYAYAANLLSQTMERDGGDVVGLLATTEDGIAHWEDLSMAQYPCYTVDDTTLKTLVRGSIGLVLLADGEIVWKRALPSVDFDTLEALSSGDEDMETLAPDASVLLWLTMALVTLLIFLILISLIFANRRLKVKNIE